MSLKATHAPRTQVRPAVKGRAETRGMAATPAGHGADTGTLQLHQDICVRPYLCRYPDLDVFTAVSTNPSLPAIQWKKNSCTSTGLYSVESINRKNNTKPKIHLLLQEYTSNGTCGLMPVRNLPETKPPAPGAGSYGWKQGKDFPEGISGGRRPSNSI